MLDLPFERLPGFANDLLVGGDGALGRHAERVGLEGHVGREFSFALRGAVKTNGTVEIFVAAVVGKLGGRVTRFGHCAGVELAGAVGYSERTLLEKWARDSKILEVGEGTTEVQLMLIARGLGL